MGLIEVLTMAGSSRAHALIAEVPGAFRERVALERALDRMGWSIAQSVADADVLAVVGEPGEEFAAVIEQVWAQMSEPRVRFQLRDETEAESLLSEAREHLRSGPGHLGDRALRHGFTPSADDMMPEHTDDRDHPEHGGHGGHGGHGEDREHEHGDGSEQGEDSDQGEDSEHGRPGEAGQHDHSAMMPDGIPLAGGAEDRDGLEMDELHLPLGPVLGHWPAGVVLRVTLHGDVIVDAEVELLATSGAGAGPEDAIVKAARLLDAAGSVLALAGLPAESARARRLRDRCLDGERVGGREVAGLGERVGRQRVLRWVMGGLSVQGSNGGPEELHDRLTGLFERARAELDGEATPHVTQRAQVLPKFVRGMGLATVRLWLAALMPDLAEHELSEATDG